MEQNKLTILAAAGLAVVALLGAIWYFNAGEEAQSVQDLLAIEGPMGDIPLGSEDAPVTIYEYASVTCGHCGTFHNELFSILKRDYIDTGKVRFVFRPFPLEPVATTGFMVARCAGEDRYHKFIDVMFETQGRWLSLEQPTQGLAQIAAQGGFTQESFQACLQNKDVLADLSDVFQRANEQLGVRSTPTFFINGEKLEGVPVDDSGQPSLVPFEKILMKHLPES